MTEINIGDPALPKAGVNRMKKANLNIDMTPMVDLGFLLISFFIFHNRDFETTHSQSIYAKGC